MTKVATSGKIFFCLCWFFMSQSINFSAMLGWFPFFPGSNSANQRKMCLAQGHNESRTCNPSTSSLTLYRDATIYRYTCKPRFTLNKYRIAIHLWLYRYTSQPYVSSSQFSSKICKKLSIIGFEIARNSGHFQNRKQLKKRKKTRCGIIPDTNKHKHWLCLTE